MANYVLCPRCELNFINADEEEFCEVCVKELSGAKTFSDDLEEEEAKEETEAQAEEASVETSEEEQGE